MRTRRSGLRPIAALLAGLWIATCLLLLLGYRPGGPLDPAVGLAAAVPVAIAAAAALRPPAGGTRRSVPVAAWLGLLTALVLAPLAAGIAGAAATGAPQAILPSPTIAYAWLVALAGTSLFAALGLVGRAAQPSSGRRLAAALPLAAALAAVSAGLMGGATLANEAALRERPAAASRFGPTDPALASPRCDGDLQVGSTATLVARLTAEVDRQARGSATIEGVRSGDDIGWRAEVDAPAASGPAGVTVIGRDGWRREPGTGWEPVGASDLAAEHLDATVLAAALVPERVAVAEDRGLVLVEGAPARRCRVALDGTLFRAAFPQVRWVAGDRSLHRWRGELDYHVFGDGQVGLVEAWVNGEAEPVDPGAIGATIRVVVEATNRGQPVVLEPPAGR